MFLYGKKKFIEKNINGNVKKIYLISEIYFYTENVCVTNKTPIFFKALLDGKLLAKLFHKVTYNRTVYEIVYRVLFSKLFKNY